MLVPGDEIVSKKIVGKLGNKELWAIGTCGGLFLVEQRSPDGSKQVIGAGSHPGVARMTAKKLHPDIEWTMLEKSQELDERDVKGGSVFGVPLMDFWLEVSRRSKKKTS